jgi:hypothetical protein
LAFSIFMPAASTSSTVACTVRSIDSASGVPPCAGSRSRASIAFSTPAVPITSAECTPSAPKEVAAQHMRGQRAVRVKPHLARAEQQAGIADLMHRPASVRG